MFLSDLILIFFAEATRPDKFIFSSACSVNVPFSDISPVGFKPAYKFPSLFMFLAFMLMSFLAFISLLLIILDSVLISIFFSLYILFVFSTSSLASMITLPVA